VDNQDLVRKIYEEKSIHREPICRTMIRLKFRRPKTSDFRGRIFEFASVEFIENGGGPGVRLRKRQRAKQSK